MKYTVLLYEADRKMSRYPAQILQATLAGRLVREGARLRSWR
ncbi:hypothetical protein [Desulfonatronum parangueonense]